MKEPLIDLQLKHLTQLCIATQNYSKLGSVVSILISNRLDEIGIKLGIKPREKDNGESMAAYMEMINRILHNNFGLTLFSPTLHEKVRYNEVVITRRSKPLDCNHIEITRNLIQCYYELRKLDVPNLYQTISSEEIIEIPNVKVLSFLSKGRAKEKNGMKGITPLVLQKIRDEERNAERQLQNHYDPELFERTLQLKTIRKSFQNQKSGKITIEGSLKDNINYMRTKERLMQYLLIGWILALCMLGAVVLTQSILFPATAFGVSPYLLVIFGACVLLILLYRYYSNSGGDYTF